ncbi:MAG: type VI secretion system tube protein Hcp [Alphaproteobacteria bacterium]|nr:type VI secretion system tube protein Hcp [Alphaproteobacteria bacterium]
MNIHMIIEGQNQGLISQACSVKEGREDTCEVFNLEQLVQIPWNEQDGRAQGSRLHRPVAILKAIDRASPMLANALVTNELLTITFNFYRFAPSGGAEEHFFTIVLEEANLVSYKAELPFTKGVDTKDLPPMERFDASFTTITTTFEPDGIVFTDSWKKPLS